MLHRSGSSVDIFHVDRWVAGIARHAALTREICPPVLELPPSPVFIHCILHYFAPIQLAEINGPTGMEEVASPLTIKLGLYNIFFSLSIL